MDKSPSRPTGKLELYSCEMTPNKIAINGKIHFIDENNDIWVTSHLPCFLFDMEYVGPSGI